MCVDAQVMLIINLDISEGLVNGSRGIIKSFSEKGLPIVEFLNGKVVEIDYHIWRLTEFDPFGRRQIPLCVAYAITIHKSQGSTFPAGTNLMIDIGIHHTQPTLAHITPSQCMSLAGARDLAAGLTYVAYSRHSVGANIWHPGYAKSRFDQNFSAPTFKLRMREENRLRLLERV